MIASFRSEWFRLIRRPAIWIVAGVLLAILALLTYLLVWVVFTHPPATVAASGVNVERAKAILYPADFPHTVLGATTGLGGEIFQHLPRQLLLAAAHVEHH